MKAAKIKTAPVTTLAPNAEGQLENVVSTSMPEVPTAVLETIVANTEAKKTESKKRGKRELDLNDPFVQQTIILDRLENPKRPNSASAKRFELYKSGMKVHEFLAAGGTRGDVNWDSTHKHITLLPAKKDAK